MTVIYSFKTVLKSDRFPFINYGHHRVTSAASIEHDPYMGKHIMIFWFLSARIQKVLSVGVKL